MKIYTKTGDQGKTSLFSGKRVSKSHVQIESYGTVDELNASLGLLKSKISVGDHKGIKKELELLNQIQSVLFSVGAYLAGAYRDQEKVTGVNEAQIETLELAIDKYNEDLPELRTFVLPGGNELASICHVCRTICRRAERRVVHLNEEEQLNPVVVKYLNRLSDYLFVLSRKLVVNLGDQEIAWTAPKA